MECWSILKGILQFGKRDRVMVRLYITHQINRETITTELLQEHFDTTFDRTKSFTVSAAFAKVLLNALINRKGKSTTDIRARTIDQAYAEYQNDFSVPRFADGLRTNEFLKLMDIYDLYGAVIHHLYTLDTRVRGR